MSHIFLHNPQNNLSTELKNSFSNDVTVLDYSDVSVIQTYPSVSKLPCFVLPYPDHQITQDVFDDDDNEIEETVDIPAGYYTFFMLTETESTASDGTRLHSYEKKTFQNYLDWKAIKEEDWS